MKSWAASTCCYNNTPLAQADISAPYATEILDTKAGVKVWTVTGLVQEWLANPASNRGLVLNSDPTKPRDRYRTFASMENGNATLRPFLRITYSAADVTPEQLRAIARYADGLGAEKTLIIPEAPDRRTLPPTTVVSDAHAAGLFVHAWTMRNEPDFLSTSYGGDPAAEVRRFIALGVDGVFSDFPDVAVRARSSR